MIVIAAAFVVSQKQDRVLPAWPVAQVVDDNRGVILTRAYVIGAVLGMVEADVSDWRQITLAAIGTRNRGPLGIKLTTGGLGEVHVVGKIAVAEQLRVRHRRSPDGVAFIEFVPPLVGLVEQVEDAARNRLVARRSVGVVIWRISGVVTEGGRRHCVHSIWQSRSHQRSELAIADRKSLG